VLNRKLPLKLHIEYQSEKQGQIQEQNKDPNISLAAAVATQKKRPQTAKARFNVNQRAHDVERYGDLQIYCSSEVKEPNEDKYTQMFINPVSKVHINNRPQLTRDQ